MNSFFCKLIEPFVGPAHGKQAMTNRLVERPTNL